MIGTFQKDTEVTLEGQIWYNLNIQINNDSKRLLPTEEHWKTQVHNKLINEQTERLQSS